MSQSSARLGSRNVLSAFFLKTELSRNLNNSNHPALLTGKERLTTGVVLALPMVRISSSSDVG